MLKLFCLSYAFFCFTAILTLLSLAFSVDFKNKTAEKIAKKIIKVLFALMMFSAFATFAVAIVTFL